MEDNSTKPGLWQRMMARARYCISGVWDDNRDTWRVKAVKIANLSVRSYLDRDLQMRSCALTFKTVLAAVPALALLFAIGRGLGFQNLLTTQLFRYFPAQRQVLDTAFTFIDNYLAQASQGAFVGIGVVVLLWTVISLMSDIESTFNRVWGAKNGRPLRRKFTDYTALLLILPVLMICSAGVSIFMSNGVQRLLGDNFMSPVVQWVLSFTPIVLAWIVFTAAYYFIPNAKVRFKGALAAGILCGTLFHLVQWLFVSGQVYVSKYNAIYGSFAFLPLLLVWLQLSWLITLSGAVVTFASQNFASYAHSGKVKDISQTLASHLAIAVLAVAVKRFKERQPALTLDALVKDYDIPGPLSQTLLDRLQRAGLLTAVAMDAKSRTTGYVPSYDPDDFTVNTAANAIADMGHTQVVPKADTEFARLLGRIADLRSRQQGAVADVRLLDLV